MSKDEYVKVLDFLEHGRSNDRENRVAQGIGTENFNLLELVMREGERPKGGEELYIGEGDRERVEFIKQRIGFDELTGNAQNELKYVLDELIRKNEDQYVEFFNEAGPVTPRRHAFELLPGVGNKTMQSILDAREQQAFESLDGLEDRVSEVSDARKLIRKRIIQELEEDVRNRLFT